MALHQVFARFTKVFRPGALWRPKALPRRDSPLKFETLEPRLLLSGTPFTFIANPAVAQDLTLSVVDVLGTPTIALRQTATSALVLSQAVVDTSEIRITLSNANDRLTVGSDFNGLLDPGEPMRIEGLGGSDRILGTTGGAYALTALDTGRALGLSFTGVENLTGAAGQADIFVVSGSGGLSGTLVGGPGGGDTIALSGGYTSVSLTVAGPQAGSLALVAAPVTRTLAFVGVEGVEDTATVSTRALTGTALADSIALTQDIGGPVEIAFGTNLTYAVVPGAGTIAVSGGAGEDSITVEDTALTLPGTNLTLSAERIGVRNASIDLTATASDGQLRLQAAGLQRGLAGTVDGIGGTVQTTEAALTLNGATLTAGLIEASAVSSATSNVTAATLAFGATEARASVVVTGGALTATKDGVSILASTQLAAAATAQAQAGSSAPAVDASIALTLARNATLVDLQGVDIRAAGDVLIRSRNVATLATTADGRPSTVTTAGAAVATAFVEGDTRLTLSGTSKIVAGGALDLIAFSTHQATTQAFGATGGAAASPGGDSRGEAVLAGANARTTEGGVAVAASVAVNRMTLVTGVQTADDTTLQSATGTRLGTVASARGTALADSARTNGNVAAAVALNLIGETSQVRLTGVTTTVGPRLTVDVREGLTGGSQANATARSGVSGSGQAGVAGALALNDVDALRTASLDPGATLTLGGGDLEMLATGTAVDTAVAEAGAHPSAGTGVGASVAINLMNRDSVGLIGDGAVVQGARGLALGAAGTGTITTTARGGASGGTAITPVVAYAIDDGDVTVTLGAGAATEAAGMVELTAARTTTLATTARGDTTATSAALGAAVAVTIGLQDTLVTLRRAITAPTLGMEARHRQDATTTAIAAVSGSTDSRTPGDRSQAQVDRGMGFASAETGRSFTPPSTQTTEGNFGLAAAIGIASLVGTTQAELAPGASFTGTGTGSSAVIAASADTDSTVTADGSVVTATPESRPGVGVGAAVALNSAQGPVRAVLNGAATAGAVVVQAGMTPDAGGSEGRSVLTTRAVAGAGARSFGLAGAVAVTEADLDATAEIGPGVQVAAAGNGTLVSALQSTEAVTEASADARLGQAGSGASGVGIGLGFAVATLDSDATAQVAATASVAGSTLSLVADGTQRSTLRAQAGTSGGSVGATPSVGITISTGDAQALLPDGPTLVLTGGLAVTALSVSEITSEVRSAAEAATAAMGLSVAWVDLADSATARVDRDVQAGGDILILARQRADITSEARASAAGVRQPAGDTAATADAQAARVQGQAAARGATGGAAPEARSSGGQFGLAAALAVTLAGGGASAQAGATAALATTGGEIDLRAEGDIDSDTRADGSQVAERPAQRPTVGVGAAVALTLAERTILARLEGTAAAATGVGIRAVMAEEGEGPFVSDLRTRAVSGAGAGTFAVSGAFALTQDELAARAILAVGANAGTTGGPVTILAVQRSAADTIATADATAGGSGGSGVGIGAAVGLNLIGARALAELGGSVGSGGNLVVRATNVTATSGRANAGGQGGNVAVVPSVHISTATGGAQAFVQAGPAATMGGRITVEASDSLTIEGTARAAAAGASAAGLGVSVALAVAQNQAVASVGRALTAGGDIAILADQRTDVALDAIASSRGVTQGTSGGSGTTADAQVARELSLANSRGGTSGAAPSARSSSGQFGLAAAIAVSIVGGASEARQAPAAALTSTGGAVRLTALSDVDSQVTADGSVVPPAGGQQQGPAVGVGAAVAINAATRVTRALIQGAVSAAAGVSAVAGMSPDPVSVNRSVLSAQAVAGAGATTAAVSGAFALNLDNLDAAATVGGPSVAAGTGDIAVLAESVTEVRATASADATLGTAGSGVGVGAGVALNLIQADATVGVSGATALSAGGGLLLSATGSHFATGRAAGGATGGTVSAAPSVYLVTSTARTEATLNAGAALALGGPVAVTADSTVDVAGTARSAATAGTAALGVSVALAILQDTVRATLARSVATSGDVTVRAQLREDVAVDAIASAAGVTQATSGTGTPSAQAQLARETNFANSTAGTSAGAPNTSTSQGQFGLAAALALTVVGGTVEAQVMPEVTVASTAGSVSIRALSDVDGTTVADASLVAESPAEEPGVGVGAAAAITLANRTTTAANLGTVTGQTGVVVLAGMAQDTVSTTRSTLTSRAVAGVGAANAGIAGSFAMNIVNLDAAAVLGAGSVTTAVGGTTEVEAITNTGSFATATADASAGTGGSGVGVGLGFALHVLDSDATAAPDATATVAGGGLYLGADGDHIAGGRAEAGVTGGSVAVAPSIYLVASRNDSRSELAGGTALTLGGSLDMFAAVDTTITGTTRSAASAGSAAVGLSVTLGVVEDSAIARLDRDVTVNAGPVALNVLRVTDLTLASTASAAGVTQAASGTDTTADQQTARQLNFLNARGGTAGAAAPAQAPDASGAATSVGIAAALSLGLTSGQGRAEIVAGRSVTAQGPVQVSVFGATGSDVTADAKTVGSVPTVGVGVAVAINVATAPLVALSAGTVVADGLTVMAVSPDLPSRLSARAIAGGGATSVGIAGAFALNLQDLSATATLTGSAAMGATGDVSLQSALLTTTRAIATSRAIVTPGEETTPSTSVGVGLSFALDVVRGRSLATLADGAVLTGGRDLVVQAQGLHTTVARAAAGSGASVGISPSLALIVSGAETRAHLGTGGALSLAGDFTLDTQHRHAATADADASARGDRVGVGAAVALAILPDSALALPARSVAAGGEASVSADLALDAVTTALASTSGVQRNTGNPGTSDAQQAALVNFANSRSGGAAAAPGAAQVGTQGGSQAVGVSAALALNLLTGRAEAGVAAGLSLSAVGDAGVSSSLDVDARAEGDGSSTGAATGIGAGVAINVITLANRAGVAGSLTAGGTARIEAGLSAQDADGKHVITARANAGAGATNVGVAAAFALNIVTLPTEALQDGTVSAGGSAVITARTATEVVAEASSRATSRGEGAGARPGAVGVGASVAINLLNTDALARVADGAGLTAAGLAMTAQGDHLATATARAGSAGQVAVSPAVALTVADNDTTLRVGTGAGFAGTLSAQMLASHEGVYASRADAEAGGSSVGVGAAIAVAVVTDAAEAILARNMAVAGDLRLRAVSRVASEADAKGGARGSAQGAPGADQQAASAVNNNSAITSRAGTQTLGKAQEGLDAGNAQVGGAAGGRQSGGVGVGAGIAVNTVVTGAEARVEPALQLGAGGILTVLSGLEVDGTARATGTALDLQNKTGIGAAVAVNVITATNAAMVGAGASLVAGGTISVLAGDRTDRGNATNDGEVRALAGGGADQVGIAGSVAVNVITFATRATVGDGSVLRSTAGGLSVGAAAAFTAQHLAGAGAIGGDVGVGAAVAVNIATLSSEARLGNGTADTAGAVQVTSSQAYLPKTETLIPGLPVSYTTVAVGGAMSRGDAGVGGSVAVDVITATARAVLADGARINTLGTATAEPSQLVRVRAVQALTAVSAAGGFGAAVGSAGIGMGVTVGVIGDTVEALVGAGAEVRAADDVLVSAGAAVTRTSVAGSFGLAGGTAGVGGSILVDTLTSTTRAALGAGARLAAGGRVAVEATDNDRMFAVAGAVGGGSTAGVGVAVATVVHTDTVEALAGAGAEVAMREGLVLRAVSGEAVTMITAAGAGASTAGVAASPAISVLTETTRATLGAGAKVAGTAGGTTPADVEIAASGTTASFKVAGAAAFGGSAAVGAGLDTSVLTKTTEATLGAGAEVRTTGSVAVRAATREDMTSLVMTGAGGGSVAVTGSAAVIVQTVTTRARIEGTAANAPQRTTVVADNNVIVDAAGQAEYDLFAGGLTVAGTTSVGASAVVPVITKVTEALIGPNAAVTGRALGPAGSTYGTGFAETLTEVPKQGFTDVTTELAGPRTLATQDVEGANGGDVGNSTAGNPDAARQLTLAAQTREVRGVSVVALNADDLGMFALNGGGAGAVAVNLSGAVAVASAQTRALIQEGAEINRAAGTHGASQDVVVTSGNFLNLLSVAASVAISGGVSVAPSAGVVVLTLETEAAVRGGAVLAAADSIQLDARSTQRITAVAAGAAAASTAAVGGSVGVITLSSRTSAHLGTVTPVGADVAATARAGRDVLVEATDDTRLFLLGGQLGGAQVGVGAAVGVSVITKDTTAVVADGSTVVAAAATSGEGMLERADSRFGVAKTARGLAVLAGADERVDVLDFTGSVGAFAGVSGAASILVIDSDTRAALGAGVVVNPGTTAVAGQDVRIVALNRVAGFTATGGLGGGAAGIGGAITVGIVRNATEALVGSAARIDAGGSVIVSARSTQDLTSFTASAGLGGVAGAISFGIWVLGGDFATGGGASSETAWTAQYQPVFAGNERILEAHRELAITATAVNPTTNTIALANSGLRTGDAVVYRAGGGSVAGLVDGQTYFVLRDATNPNLIRLATSRAAAAAGLAIDLGAQSGTGASLALADTARSDDAIATARGRIVAGQPQTQLAATTAADPVSEGTLALTGEGAVITAAGGLRVWSRDELTLAQVSGNVALGGTGIGASFATVVHGNRVLAQVGAQNVITVGGFGLDLRAASTEGVTQVAVGGAVGASVGLAGSGTITLLRETTQAILGTETVVRATTNDVRAVADVGIVARDDTRVVGVSGSLGFGGAAGVGVGLDLADVQKRTEALIAPAADVQTDGSIALRAGSTEEIVSAVVTGSAAGAAAVAGSAGVVLLTADTVALVEAVKDREAPVPTVLDARGAVVVEAFDDTEIDVFAGALSVGGTAAVGAGAAVPVVTKRVRAEVGAGNTVIARGQGTGLSVRTGDYTVAFETAGRNDVASAATGSGSSGYVDPVYGNGNPGQATPQDGRPTGFDDGYAGMPGTGQARRVGAFTAAVTGLAVSATSADDIATIGVSGGVSGLAAVNLSGAVTSLNTSTIARIGADVTVNPAAITDAATEQAVRVLAGSDLNHLAVAVSIAGAGAAAVAPSAAVAFLSLSTQAVIDAGAQVRARGGVTVDARSVQQIALVGAGGGLAGVVGFGATTGIVSLNLATRAEVGQGARVEADGSVRIAANDDTRVFGVVGAIGVAGVAGVGASAEVLLIRKDTVARIGEGATVVALGGGAGDAGSAVADLDKGKQAFARDAQVRGVVVEATSSETVTVLAYAGAGALFFGLGGAAAVVVADSDTLARIDDGATVKAGGVGQAASVRVGAANRFLAFMHAGAVAGGAVGLGGAVGIGILRNGQEASLGATADVSASGDVGVTALSVRDIDTLTVSAAAGLGALVGSVSVWTLGGTVDSTYSYSERSASLDGSQTAGTSSTPRSADGLGGSAGTWDNTYEEATLGPNAKTGGGWEEILNRRSIGAGGSSSRLDAGNAAGFGRVRADGPHQGVETALAPVAGDLEDTVARIEATAQVAATGRVEVTAADLTVFDSIAGGGLIGGVSFGASVGVANLNMDVRAESRGALTAGSVLVRATGETDAESYAIVGSAGLVTLGAQVALVRETGARAALLAGSVSVAGASAVAAGHAARLTTMALGIVPLSAVNAGVSVAVAEAAATVSARATGAVFGTAPAAALDVTAAGNATVLSQAWGIGIGVIGAINGAVAFGAARMGIEAVASVAGSLPGTLGATATSAGVVTTKALSASISGLASLAAGVAVSVLSPDVTALAGIVGTAGSITARAVHNANPVTGVADGTRGALATAWSVSGALVAGVAGAFALAETAPVVTARVAGGGAGVAREARAFAGVRSVADATGLSGGIVGVGASLSFARSTGTITAEVQGTSGGAVTVDARGTTQAIARTRAVSGGLLAGTFNYADAVATTPVLASFSGGTVAGSAGAVLVQAQGAGLAEAETRGATVGALALGLSIARARFAPTVTAQVAGGIAGAAAVTVAATITEGTARATSGGSGGNVGVGIVSALAGIASAVNAATATATLSGAVTATGEVRVSASHVGQALADVSDRNFGIVAIGGSQATATNTGSAIAQLAGTAIVTAGALAVQATGTFYGRARGDAAQGGILTLAVGPGVEAITRVETTVRAQILGGARVTATGAISAISRNESEGDGDAQGVSGGVVAAGVTRGSLTVRPTAETRVGAGARVEGASVTLRAFGGRAPVASAASYDFAQNPTDLIDDTIRVTNHGLVTGQAVQISQTEGWANAGRVYSVLGVDSGRIRLGADFDAAAVEAATDIITFRNAHGLQTGDRVIYNRGANLSIINGSTPIALFALVIDGFRIKLLDYNPTSGLTTDLVRGGSAVNTSTDRITIAGHGLNSGDLVTYRRPVADTFNAAEVDLNLSRTAADPGANNIFLAGHRFQTGDAVVYGTSLNGTANTGTVIAGLVRGTTYFVIRVNADTIRLASTLGNAGAGTALALTPVQNSVNDRATVHSLAPSSAASIGGLVDGRAYRVNRIDANVLQLRDAATNAIVNLTSTGGTNTHALVREGVDLVARTGTHAVYLDMTAVVSATLTGPGGQSLLNAVLNAGDGRSRLTVDGLVGGGFAIGSNLAQITLASTVRTVVEAGTTASPTRLIATGAVSLSTENRFDGNVSATAGGGGIFSFGSASSVADYTATTETLIGSTASGAAGSVLIEAGGAVSATALQLTTAAASASASGGGVIATATADADLDMTFFTRANLGQGARITAGGAVSFTADSRHTETVTMSVNSGGLGTGANAGQNAASGAKVSSASRNEVVVAQNARIETPATLVLMAVTQASATRTTARTDAAAAGADSDARAVSLGQGANEVRVLAGADLRGTAGLTLASLVRSYAVSATASANLVALGGSTDSRADAQGPFATRIETAAGSTLRTRDLLVDTQRGAGNAGLTLSDTATRSGALIDVGGSSEGNRTPGGQSVAFNGNVVLLRTAAAVARLEVNAAGVVTVAQNVTVEGGNGVGFDADGDGVIRVDAITIETEGRARFRSDASGVLAGTTGLWTVEKGMSEVTIRSASSATLRLGRIDMAFASTSTALRDVDIQVPTASGFRFAIASTHGATLPGGADPRLTVETAGGLALGGAITSPIGVTRLVATGGGIVRDSNSADIVTRRLEIDAADDVGQSPTNEFGFGQLVVTFVKAGSRTPSADILVDGTLRMIAFAAQRDTTATRPNVQVERLAVTGDALLQVTDTSLETQLPATHSGGLTVGAQSSLVNTAAGIATSTYYRNAYFPEGAANASVDRLAIYGQRPAAGSFGNATWTFGTVTVTGTLNVTRVPSSASTTITLVGLPPGSGAGGGPGLSAARLAATALEVPPAANAETRTVFEDGAPAVAAAAGARGPADWTAIPTATGVIDWDGQAA